jgi:periplasmic protein TonB
MFTNLIESQSHRREFKRRSSFFLFTVAAYAVILFGAGIGSIYAYDAQLEAQLSSLELMSWVPPVTPPAPKQPAERPQTVRRTTPTNAPVDPTASRSERTQFVSPTSDPRNVPTGISTQAVTIPPYTPGAVLSNRNVDPPRATGSDKNDCLTCPDTASTVTMTEKPPTPLVEKPPTTQRVTSVVLSSKAVALPQPPYPMMAKQMRIQGLVSVQILVDEQGKVISAQVVSGNPALSTAARDAALRARFTPTTLNGQPVKIQGVINYNFTMP